VPRRVPVREASTWLVLGLALAGATLYTGLRVVTPSDGARVAFYADAWSAAGVRISAIDAPAEGLHDGDLVVAIDGRSMDDWVRDAFSGGGTVPGTDAPIPYLVDRAGSAIAVGVTWAPPSVGATLLEGWSVILFSLATAGIAAFVFLRRPREPAASALMVAAAGAAGSTIPWFLGVTTSEVVRGWPFLLQSLLTGPLYMLLWPAGIHLALVFPSPARVVRRRPWLIPAVYAVALGTYAALTLAALVTEPTLLDWVGTWPLIQALIVVSSLGVAIPTLAVRYLRLRDPVRRAKLRLATLGAVVSGVVGLVLFMGPVLLTGRPLVPDAAIGLIALPLPVGIAAGIMRDNLFDIEVVLNRTLVYGGLTLGVVVTYAAAAAATTSLLGADRGYGASLLAAGLAALVALPLRDVLQRGVNRMMYGQRDEPWRVMHTLGARLEWAAEPELAFPAIADTVTETLRLPYVAVEVSDEVGRSTVVVERGRPGGPTETVPLVHGAQPVGRLVLGIRSGERGFRPDELDLLHDLGRQAGAAVQAQRLRTALARSRERLVVAREEERRRLRRDLHDGLGPSLAAIGMRADASAAVLDDDPAAARRQLEALSAEVQTALADVRRLVDGLRPPALDELGLLGAIGQQAARLDHGGSAAPHEHGVTIEVEGRPPTMPALPAAVEVAAYRIAVEAMTNAVRHAGARSCRVTVSAGAQLTIEVVDDGRGLPDEPRAGTGLESMRERAAELGGDIAVQRPPHGGTHVLARLPLDGVVP
jgi:signal transduction histidine kinase